MRFTLMPKKTAVRTQRVAAAKLPMPMGVIERRIYVIRDQKVMLDTDLADLYQVPTYRLNEAVKRNLKRFPPDFMFQLSPKESGFLTSQIAISKTRGGRRTPPFAFTEHGVTMLSSVLRSARAIQMNILVVRAFVRIRELVTTQKELAIRMDMLEEVQKRHASVIGILADEIEDLKQVPVAPRRRIGFATG